MKSEVIAGIPDEFLLTDQEMEVLASEEWARVAHSGLVSYARKTVHGQRFKTREFDRDVSHFRLDRAHVEGVADAERTASSALLANSLISNMDEFSGAIHDAYYSTTVQEHLDNGGSLIFADNHITYEGEPGLEIGLTQERLKKGEDLEDIVASQQVVAGRLIGTFDLHGLDVVEDLLLPNGNLLQTLPLTPSGDVLPDFVRKLANKLFKFEQYRTLKTPGSITIVNFSGTQDLSMGNTYVMQPVHDRTIELYTALGKDAAHLMVVPFFIRSEAIDRIADKTGPEQADFAFGEPMTAKSDKDIYAIQRRIKELGTECLQTSLREDRRGRRVIFDINGEITGNK